MKCITLKARNVTEHANKVHSLIVSESEWIKNHDEDGEIKGWMLVVHMDIQKGPLKRDSIKPTSHIHTFCFYGGAETIVVNQIDMLAPDFEDWFEVTNKKDRDKLSSTLKGVEFKSGFYTTKSKRQEFIQLDAF